MKKVEVIIEADGSIKIDAIGFKGAECEKATKFLEDALGAVSSSTKKPEYNQQQGAQQKAGR